MSSRNPQAQRASGQVVRLSRSAIRRSSGTRPGTFTPRNRAAASHSRCIAASSAPPSAMAAKPGPTGVTRSISSASGPASNKATGPRPPHAAKSPACPSSSPLSARIFSMTGWPPSRQGQTSAASVTISAPSKAQAHCRAQCAARACRRSWRPAPSGARLAACDGVFVLKCRSSSISADGGLGAVPAFAPPWDYGNVLWNTKSNAFPRIF